ncbi:Crp/Fnr family transcriptional regulator [Actinomadura sp. HBU206391]|uniref:Crp/Fnr family transcriptional regulator n=1 Tax=Actinomadura sp. HBU206391 TaxID=2731692 RepID=UPI00164FB634|nr:Crp/Fnr family transcriptional regulator [Actinomadura sp. HBU206391]MBC6456362.1 Crp/Fnr family transcriptional regulator [Actinomadura sp. HBU206391]
MNFRSLVSADVWRDLIDRGRRRTYPSNAVLLAQGESPDCVIALVDGLVKVVQSNECGDELTLMLRGPGEVLGEMGALLGRPRSATVTAARRCTGVVLPAHAFRGYVERHRLERVIYQLTVERLNSHERLRADLVHLPSIGRVARVVSHLADEVGQPQGATSLLVELGMPRTELATMAAMRRSSALVALGQLQSADILTLGRRRLIITDVARLRAVARGEEDLGVRSGEDAAPAM